MRKLMKIDPGTIARILGGTVTGRDSANVPGPGHSPNDRSLSIKLSAGAPSGFIVHSHAGDDPIDCRDYVRSRLGLGPWQAGVGRSRGVVTSVAPDSDQERRKAFALQLWFESINPAGTIVEHYLRAHRGLELAGDLAGHVVRFHPRLRLDASNRKPGMVCLLRNITTDEPCGIHRTFLDTVTGEKIDRKMLGIAKSAAIKLDSPAAIAGALTIGEGFETSLAGRMANLGQVWALGSSGAVRAFPVLPNLTEVTILEENDPTSRRDVEVCARRYLDAGRPVNIVTPDVGKDLNDAWRAIK
jgi:putative DNA primase/helicase